MLILEPGVKLGEDAFGPGFRAFANPQVDLHSAATAPRPCERAFREIPIDIWHRRPCAQEGSARRPPEATDEARIVRCQGDEHASPEYGRRDVQRIDGDLELRHCSEDRASVRLAPELCKCRCEV